MPSEAGNSKESSGSYLFAIPVADSRYRAASAEENQAVNLNELQDLDNSFLLWKSAMTARDNLYDAVKDLEAAEQYKNGLRDISDISSGNLKEVRVQSIHLCPSSKHFIVRPAIAHPSHPLPSTCSSLSTCPHPHLLNTCPHFHLSNTHPHPHPLPVHHPLLVSNLLPDFQSHNASAGPRCLVNSTDVSFLPVSALEMSFSNLWGMCSPLTSPLTINVSVYKENWPQGPEFTQSVVLLSSEFERFNFR
ncbi:uncharacterized protein LOC132382172 isoform X1 [Hypanus sabinus]|uniref:uncharacterized protein LOC132382172 isoform X1 n=1 Tax=Hypanus sabinus TaxID=79690 RepID=UPI0028C4891C|nr:uncharacterized protein LOC132382172 isoform X1 [Hypanus sabinus]